MPLKGKKCILIISTYRTGINEVSNYLYKICSYLGLEVVGLITSDYKTTKNVLCNEIDISLDYLETGLLNKCTNVAYSDYIYNLYDKLYKDMLKNNLITFELAYWCKLHQ